MDILALLSTPLPAYFTVGPLVILFVLLVTLSLRGKSEVTSSPSAVVAQSPVAPASTTPVSGVQEPVPAPVVDTIAAASPVVQIQQEVPASAPVPPVVPPVSSWKPSAPVAMEVPQEAFAVAPQAVGVTEQVPVQEAQVAMQEPVSQEDSVPQVPQQMGVVPDPVAASLQAPVQETPTQAQ